MCGRYAITSAEALRQWFQTYGSLPNWPANYNAAPTNILPVVRQTKEGREIALMERKRCCGTLIVRQVSGYRLVAREFHARSALWLASPRALGVARSAPMVDIRRSL
jgi:putative SOS response-associated peptidase YedK